MLRVRTIYASGARASARYYTSYLAGDDGEGEWLGKEAERLGLGGVVSTDDLEALLAGHDPTTGVQLGTPLLDRVGRDGRLIPAVAGYDATFSAPNSVSVLWGLTADPGLLESHDVAVRAVLAYLEQHGATTRVRVNGGRQHLDTAGLTMAAFRQTTSREDDPQIHSHVVISTKVRTAEGRWMALDARFLKKHQRALGGLYQSVLRAEISHRYGFAWGDIDNGQAEILGMPAELLDVFSKRSAQIDEALAAKVAAFREREGRDPSRLERAVMTREAAMESRPEKSHEASADLRDRWHDEAAEVGWTADQLVDIVGTAARTAPVPGAVAVDAVIEHLSANGSCWTRADVLRAVCDLVPPTQRFSGVERAAVIDRICVQVLAACVSLDPTDTPGDVRASDGRSIWLAPTEPHLTHSGIVAQEERILSFALAAGDARSRPSTTVEPRELDVLQAEAAAAVAGNAPLVLVVGAAGAGKARTLRHAADDLCRQNRPVFGVAPTAKAAKVLRDDAGIAADTVAKLLHEWRHRHPSTEYRLPPGTTVALDEAGMVGTGALDRLIALAKAERWRLVLVGDHRQLQAVGRGRLFEELCRIGTTHELATVHRFHHRWEQAASLQLRAANPDAIDAYAEHGRINSGTFDQVAAEIAQHWVEHTSADRTVAVVADTNAHVDALNAAIQRERNRLGDLGDVLVRVAGDETAAVGDIIVTRRNDRKLRTDLDEPIRNRDRWRVVRVGGDGSLAVDHLDGHGQVTLAADYVREHVRLGYAATTYGHQGDTVDVGLAVVTETASHRGLYVAATRATDENRLFVVTDDPESVRDILERVLTSDRADVPAVMQRRNLAEQIPSGRGERASGDPVEDARLQLADARRRAQPYVRPLHDATDNLRVAEAARRAAIAAHADAPRRHRHRYAKALAVATASAEDALQVRDAAEKVAARYVNKLKKLEKNVKEAEFAARIEQAQRRLDQVALRSPARSVGQEIGGLRL